LRVLILSVHYRLLARMDRESAAGSRHLAFTVAYRDVTLIGVGIRIDAIVTRTRDRERLIRCIDLDASKQMGNVHVERALRKTYLRHPVIQIQKLKSRVRSQPEERARNFHFRERAIIGI
jgi:hypothetical protein